jgi:tetratricopeptide (TPR) repeat protein
VLFGAACKPGVREEDIPLPDLSGVEQEIVDVVHRLRDAVRQSPTAEAWGNLGARYHKHEWNAEAEACYVKAAELEPGKFVWIYRAGHCLFKGDDPAGAVEHFRRAMALRDTYAPAHVSFAQALSRLGHGEEAAKHFSRASALAPDSSHAELGLGQLALEAGRYPEALEHLVEAVRRDPQHGEAHVALSQAFLATGDPARAAEHAERSRTLEKITLVSDPLADPLLPPAGAREHTDLGKALEEQGRAEEARAQYLEAFRINPDYLRPHVFLGSLLARQGDLGGARHHLEEALRIQESHVIARETLSLVLLRTGEAEEAIRHLEQVLALEPDRASTRSNLAGILAGAGRMEEAAAHFGHAVRVQPTDPDAQAGLAQALARLGRSDEAEPHFLEALRLVPSHPSALLGLGNLELARGRAEEAIRHFRATLDAHPQMPQAALRLAWVLATHPDARLRNADEAVRLAEHAVRTTSGRSFLALDALAAALAETGRHAEAAEKARQALAIAESSGRTERAAEIGVRLALYEAGRPFRAGR